MIAVKECLSSRAPGLALSEASSATINDSKVRPKRAGCREMGNCKTLSRSHFPD
jgi:hypothetical protein